MSDLPSLTPDPTPPSKDHAGLWLGIICGMLLLLVIVMNASC
jgi:hypothetical protein